MTEHFADLLEAGPLLIVALWGFFHPTYREAAEALLAMADD